MLIVPDWLVTTATEPAKRSWAIRVVGDRVDAVGPAADLLAHFPDDEVVDATGHVVMPGFVNAHVHLYGVLATAFP